MLRTTQEKHPLAFCQLRITVTIAAIIRIVRLSIERVVNRKAWTLPSQISRVSRDPLETITIQTVASYANMFLLYVKG